MSNIIQVNEEKIKGELGELVRKTVEEMLNEMLDAEADDALLPRAERIPERDTIIESL